MMSKDLGKGIAQSLVPISLVFRVLAVRVRPFPSGFSLSIKICLSIRGSFAFVCPAIDADGVNGKVKSATT